MREELEKIVNIHRRPQFLASTIFISFLFYSGYALARNSSILRQYATSGDIILALNLIPGLISDFGNTVNTEGLLFASTIAILVGLNLTVAIFRLSELSEIDRKSAGSIGGLLVAFLAPACSACAAGVVGAAGSTTLFALLPFGGLEIRVIAVALLIGSAYYTANQIGRKACKL